MGTDRVLLPEFNQKLRRTCEMTAMVHVLIQHIPHQPFGVDSELPTDGRICYTASFCHVTRKRSAANFWGQIRAFKYQDPCVAINTGRCNSLTGLTKEVCCSSDRSPELLRKWHPDPRSKYDWGPEVWLLPYLRYHHVVGCVDLRKPASGDHGVFHKEREGTPRWSPKVMVPSKPQPLPLPLPVAAPKVVQPRMPPPLAHALPLVNESGPQQLLKSYIISHSSTSARFNWTQKLATRMGFESTFIEAYTSENMAEPKQFVHANIMFFRGRPDREGQHLPQVPAVTVFARVVLLCRCLPPPYLQRVASVAACHCYAPTCTLPNPPPPLLCPTPCCPLGAGKGGGGDVRHFDHQ